MNKRDALRFAANELLEVAQNEAACYALGERAIPDEWSDRDITRVTEAFSALAARLEYTVTGERVPRAEVADPNQIPLFEEKS